MRLNQYEKSIYVLKENIPNFIRLAYSTFADLFNVLFEDCICEAAKEIPSSTRDVCRALICYCDSRRVSFSDICFKYFTKINNIREFNEKLANLAVHGKEEFLTSKEDIFFNVNDTDIEAPVVSIRGVFSLANEIIYGCSRSSSKTDVCEKIVPLIFQPIFSAYDHNNREDIKDLTGTDSILSHGTTELCVDLGALFDSFFEKAIDLSKFGESEDEAIVSSESEVVSRETEECLESYLNGLSCIGKVIQNKASDICEGITKTLLASALATYTIYASKLIGSKQDIYDWAYKAFVKDSLSFIDVKDYINNADITRYSGHRAGEKDCYIGKPYGMPCNEITDTDGNIRTTLNCGALNADSNGDLPISVKKIIYRSIRLQYSLWASVINSIFCTGKSDRTKPHNYSSITYNTVDPIVGNRYNSLLELSRAIFSSFAKARYRTFNTGTQFTEKREAVSSLSSVDIGISKIVDQKAKEILKESTKSFKIGSLFFNDLNNSVILTEANNKAVSEIRKLFIQTAYLLMLNKINQNSGKILEDEDPITGKTRKELFNEIYYGISINLSKSINNAVINNFDSAFEVFETLKDTGLSAFVSAVSPTDDIYGKLGERINNEKHFKSMCRKVCDIVCYPKVRETFDNTELSDTKEIFRWFIMDRVLVPYYSDFLDIKSASCNYKFVDRIPDEDHFTDFAANNKTGTLFPKNRIVVDQLNMVSKMQAEKNKYFTIESINSAMDDLEISMCASDAMANNGSYNSLANIGSSISSLEIGADNADDAGYSPVDESNTRLNANENPLEGTITNTDANGIELGLNPTDAEDQKKFTVHDSMESAHASQMEELNRRFIEKTVERYNELFNKIIFNVEKK